MRFGLPWSFLPYKLLTPDAQPPKYANEYAAGMDLFANESVTIPAKQKRLVKTGIAFNIPDGHFLEIKSRSGLSVKYGIEHGAGVIDEDYTKEVGVILHNHGDEPFVVTKGERVAQAILQEYVHGELVDAGEFFVDTNRGGFGSTGMK